MTGDADQIVEIGESALALRQRIGFGKTAAEIPRRRQIVGDRHRGGGGEQFIRRSDDALGSGEAATHRTLFLGIVRAHRSLVGEETAAHVREQAHATVGTGSQPVIHNVCTFIASWLAPAAPARRHRGNVGVGYRATRQRRRLPAQRIALRQPKLRAQVSRARRETRRIRGGETARTARKESNRRILPQSLRQHRRDRPHRIAVGIGAREQLAQHLALQRACFAVFQRAKPRQNFRLEREAREQSLAETVDRLHPHRAAGAVDHRGEQRPCAVEDARLGPVGAERGEIEPQIAVSHPHPHRQPLVDAVRHFGGARLGKGDAQDRLGRHPREHQSQHARRQHLRLARPRRRAQPDMVVRLRRGALPAVECLEQLFGVDHAAPSSVGTGSGSPRPNHSSRRISWSKSA